MLYLFLVSFFLLVLPIYSSNDDGQDVSTEYINYYKIFNVMLTINSSINCFSTVLSIALMVKLELHKRIFMSMVVLMTCFQLIYDFSLIPCNHEREESCNNWRASAIGLGVFSGVASNAVTNQMAVVVAYILLTKKACRIPNWVTAIHTLVPSFALGIPAFIGFLEIQGALDNDDVFGHYFFVVLQVYVILRGVQVMINFVATFVIVITLAELDFGNANVCGWLVLSRRASFVPDLASTHSASTISGNSATSGQSTVSSTWYLRTAECIYKFFTCSYFYEFSTKIKRRNYPMFALAGRLIGYPIVQSLSRFGASWYELDQGTTTELYLKTIMSSEDRQLQTVELFVYCLLVPLGGLGCFVIFLRIESDARDLLKQWLYYLFTCGGSLNSSEEEPSSSQKTSRKTYYYQGERYTFSGTDVTSKEFDKYYDKNDDSAFDTDDDSGSDESIDRERYSHEAESARRISNDLLERASYTYGNTMAIMVNRPSTDTSSIRNPLQESTKGNAYNSGHRNNSDLENPRGRSMSRDKRQSGRKRKGNKVVVNLDQLIAEGDDTVVLDSNDGNQLKDMYKHLTDEEIMDIIVLQAHGKEEGEEPRTNSLRKRGSNTSRNSSKTRKEPKKSTVKNISLAVLKEARQSYANEVDDHDNEERSGGEALEMTAVDKLK